MALIIDLIIIAIILMFTFLGYHRGLVKLALNLCTFFIAIIVAFALYKPVSMLVINNTSIDESIEQAISDKILPENASEDEKISLDSNLPQVFLKQSTNTVNNFAKSLSTTLIQTICFFIIFILAKIILRFVTFLADLIAKLPILNQFNKLGGTIYGILEGLFIVFVIFAIISISSPLLDESILNSINQSNIGAWFYNNNLLLNILAK